MSAKEQDTAEGVKKTLSAPKRLAKPISAKVPAKLVKQSKAKVDKVISAVKKPEVAKAVGVVKKTIAKEAGSAKVEVKESKIEKPSKALKKPKLKVVRDSFTMPESEYGKIAEIKASCLKAGVQVKKSEVLRAGVIALCSISEPHLKTILASLDKIKTGRPNKN